MMEEVVETLLLTALVSAFVGLIGLAALARPDAAGLSRFRNTLRNIVTAAAVVSLLSFALYVFSPREEVRSSVYGAGDAAR